MEVVLARSAGAHLRWRPLGVRGSRVADECRGAAGVRCAGLGRLRQTGRRVGPRHGPGSKTRADAPGQYVTGCVVPGLRLRPVRPGHGTGIPAEVGSAAGQGSAVAVRRRADCLTVGWDRDFSRLFRRDEWPWRRGRDRPRHHRRSGRRVDQVRCGEMTTGKLHEYCLVTVYPPEGEAGVRGGRLPGDARRRIGDQ